MELETVQFIIALTMFVIGTLFGSFFSLATYRLPRKQDITHTRSYCPKCKHKLGFFDCFPILSYVSTVGRCKYCNCFISYRYPLMELASGLVFLIAYLYLGLTLNLFIILACYIYLFLLIGSDIMKKNMTAEEIKESEQIEAKKKETKKTKKRGALNIEIVVALIVFVMYFGTTVYITKNYRYKLDETSARSIALNVCINKVEEINGTNFESIIPSTVTAKIQGVNYKCDVYVQPYLKNDYIQIDNAKDILVKVTYTYSGKLETFSIPLIKEVMQ